MIEKRILPPSNRTIFINGVKLFLRFPSIKMIYNDEKGYYLTATMAINNSLFYLPLPNICKECGVCVGNSATITPSPDFMNMFFTSKFNIFSSIPIVDLVTSIMGLPFNASLQAYFKKYDNDFKGHLKEFVTQERFQYYIDNPILIPDVFGFIINR